MPRTIKGKYKKNTRVFEPLEPVELADEEIVEIVVPEETPKTANEDPEWLASAGSWKDLVPESFIDDVYEARRKGDKPPVSLE